MDGTTSGELASYWSRNYIRLGWNMTSWNMYARLKFLCLLHLHNEHRIGRTGYKVPIDKWIRLFDWWQGRVVESCSINLRKYFYLEKKQEGSSLSRDLRFQNYILPDHTFVILRALPINSGCSYWAEFLSAPLENKSTSKFTLDDEEVCD